MGSSVTKQIVGRGIASITLDRAERAFDDALTAELTGLAAYGDDPVAS